MSKFLLTMQHDEHAMLPIFLNHYLRFFAADCIYVLDHGTRVQTAHTGINRISVPRGGTFSELDRLFLVQSIANGLLRFFDWGVYADCDELIAMDFVDERALATQKILHVAGFEAYREEHGDETDTRLLGLLNPSMCKPLIFTEVPNWNAGFHMALGVEPPAQLSVPMCHIRFLYPDIARERMVLRRGIPESMPDSERSQGYADHWKRGEALLADFQTLTSGLAQLAAPVIPFAPISRDAVLKRSTTPVAGRGDIPFWASRGDYKSAKVRYDLTPQFDGVGLKLVGRTPTRAG